MKTLSHTLGPWKLDGLDCNASVVGPDEKLVVAGEGDGWMVPFACRGDVEGLANARLVAAAPQLLAVAIELLRNAVYEDGQAICLTQNCEALEQAIAKAKGE